MDGWRAPVKKNRSLISGSASPATGTTPSASAQPTAAASQAAEGPIGEITITAFDLGFEPATVHVDAPGTYTVEIEACTNPADPALEDCITNRRSVTLLRP